MTAYRLPGANPLTMSIVYLLADLDDGDTLTRVEILEHFDDMSDAARRLADLVAYGAVRRIRNARPDNRHGERNSYRLTRLGRAWLDQELPPLPTRPE